MGCRPGEAGPQAPEPTAAPEAARPRRTVGSAAWRFGVVGVVGTLVNLAVVWLLHELVGVRFAFASAAATEVAIISNYLGNELWTFHLRRLSLRRLAKFNLAALAALVVTVTVATIAVMALHPLLAQLVGICAGAAVNFTVNFGWTWRDPQPRER